MAKTHEQFVEEIEKNNPSVEVIGRYIKAIERIQVRCKQCGYVWNPKASYLSTGRACPRCRTARGVKNNHGKTAVKTQDQFIREMSIIHPTVTVLGDYINGHTNVECACSVCSYRWYAKPYSLLQNHGCPRCAKSGTSFMEQYILLSFIKALGDGAVVSRNRALIGMELDIYIPELCVAIEPGNWFLHSKNLARDILKRNECKKLGIRLITIYDKFPPEASVPFDEDCYVFAEDLNRTDRNVIKRLVLDLFDNLSIPNNFSQLDWQSIETKAYENARAKTHNDFVQELDVIHPNIEVLGKYKNANIRILVKCRQCNNEWEAVPANLLSGDGCRKCGTKSAHEKFIKNQAEFEKQVYEVNPNIDIIGVYTGRHKPVQAKCCICGHEWYPIAASLLRGSNHKGWKTIHKQRGL